MTDPSVCWVLVHSPLVGPTTWSLVADELRRRSLEVVVPTLRDDGRAHAPYWQRHSEAAAKALASVPRDRPLVLAGHSGAGCLLPLIARLAPSPVAAYMFVDAGLPLDGSSRLDEMATTNPELASELRRHLEAGGRFPEWTDEQLRELVPDTQLRRQVLAELHPRPLAFFAEPFPELRGRPDAPCAYLQLSPAYAKPAAAAKAAGWPCRAFDAGHFHMLVDPTALADALPALLGELQIRVSDEAIAPSR